MSQKGSERYILVATVRFQSKPHNVVTGRAQACTVCLPTSVVRVSRDEHAHGGRERHVLLRL